MTIAQVLDSIDECKPNKFSLTQKIEWLSELDRMVFNEILMTHEGMPKGVTFEGYDQETPMDTELLIPDAYAEVYIHCLARHMDQKNGELDKYQNDTTLFNSAYMLFSNYWNRTHMPISRVPQFRF